MSNDIITIGDISFSTLIAITSEEQTTGLMYKKWPPPVMCFPYKNAYPRSFWMKNTISPLDIIFCKDNKIISICYGEPLSTRQVGPYSPIDLVIELPHGTAAKHKFSVGNSVYLSYSAKTGARDIRNDLKQY